MQKGDSDINNLINAILKIRGSKIVTLVDRQYPPISFDVSPKGFFGRHESHKRLFEMKLQRALKTSGGLIVRQFLPIKVEKILPNGESIWIPRKKVYGVSLGNGLWMPLTASQIRDASCTDAATGKPMPPEDDVSYHDFPVAEKEAKRSRRKNGNNSKATSDE